MPVETDSSEELYRHGDLLDSDSAGYPMTFDPEKTIKELIFFETGADIVADVTLVSGDTLTIPLVDIVGELEKYEIGSVTFKDPSDTGQRTVVAWAGE